MQSYLWMRPALQISEAVLLPALPRRSVLTEARFSDRLTSPSTEPFRPVPVEGIADQPMALSTYVRPRGSMAGRGVLRAAGVSMNPYRQWARPAYAGPGRSIPMSRRCRVR
mgnify:FL=1